MSLPRATMRLASLARVQPVAMSSVKGVRNMSHGSPEEVYASKELWFKISVYAFIGVFIPYGAAVLYKEMTGSHGDKGTVYPHMAVRHKAFPWTLGNCDLFDLHCKADARAALRGEVAPHH